MKKGVLVMISGGVERIVTPRGGPKNRVLLFPTRVQKEEFLMRRTWTSQTGLTRTAAHLTAALALTASAATVAAAPPAAITFQHDGIEALFPDERDAGFLRALRMIPGRLLEISRDPDVGDELGDVPAELFPMAGALLMDPMRFIVTIDGLDDLTGFPKIGAVLRYEGAEADGGAIGRGMNVVESMVPMPLEFSRSEAHARMKTAETAFGALSYGARESGGEWGWEAHFGAVTDPEEWLGSDALKADRAGVVAKWSIDFAALTPATRSLVGMLSMMTPGVNLAREAVNAGLLGDKAVSVQMESGFAADHSFTTMRTKGARAFAEPLGLIEEVLEDSDLGIIPADATAGVVAKIDPMRSWKSMREQMAASGQDGEIDRAIAEFERQTGVDFEEDLLGSLGGTVVMYFSDSTGGGSMLSGVMGIRLSDPARFDRAMDRLTRAAEQMIAESGEVEGPVAVRFARSQSGPRGFTTFRIDGLPLPVEPTMGRMGDWAIVALSPSAAHGALAHGGSGSSIAGNALFGGDWRGGEDLVSLSFVDSKRTIRDGYSSLNLVTTALAGFVRSSEDPRKDPGMILPSYHELAKDARATISRTYWSGDDYVMHTTGDRSRLAQAAAVMGVGDLGSFVAGAITGSGITSAIFGARDAGAFDGYEFDEESWETDDGDEPEQREVPY